jgi:hypothetical protein
MVVLSFLYGLFPDAASVAAPAGVASGSAGSPGGGGGGAGGRGGGSAGAGSASACSTGVGDPADGVGAAEGLAGCDGSVVRSHVAAGSPADGVAVESGGSTISPRTVTWVVTVQPDRAWAPVAVASTNSTAATARATTTPAKTGLELTLIADLSDRVPGRPGLPGPSDESNLPAGRDFLYR